MKNNFSKTGQNLMTRTSVFYVFTNPFNIWLNRNNWVLISASSFNLLQYPMSCSFWKTPLYTHERMSEKVKFHLSVIVHSFDLADALKGSQMPPGVSVKKIYKVKILRLNF